MGTVIFLANLGPSLALHVSWLDLMHIWLRSPLALALLAFGSFSQAFSWQGLRSAVRATTEADQLAATFMIHLWYTWGSLKRWKGTCEIFQNIHNVGLLRSCEMFHNNSGPGACEVRNVSETPGAGVVRSCEVRLKFLFAAPPRKCEMRKV